MMLCYLVTDDSLHSHDALFGRFDTTYACDDHRDREMDGQTEGHRINTYGASRASGGSHL